MSDQHIPKILLQGSLAENQLGLLAEVAREPGSKIIHVNLDMISSRMFDLLGAEWNAPHGSVPELAQVFPFRAFAVWRSLVKTVVAAHRALALQEHVRGLRNDTQRRTRS
jgi:hypothetical protein